MNKLSQKEWDGYVSYVLANNPIDQRYRVYGILLEDFDWAYKYTEDPNVYAKSSSRNVDLINIEYALSQIPYQMYEKARRPIEEKNV